MEREIKDWLKIFLNDQDEKANPEDYLSKEEIEERKRVLDAYQFALKHEITNYELELTDDLLDTDESDLIRIFLFNRGMEDFAVLIRPCGLVAALSPNLPNELLADVMETIADVLRG